MPLHHGVQSRVNKMSSNSGGLSMVSHGIMNNKGTLFKTCDKYSMLIKMLKPTLL